MAFTESVPTTYPNFAPLAKLYILSQTTTTDPNIGTAVDMWETTDLKTYLGSGGSAYSDTTTAIVKNVTITPGTRDVGIIYTMGSSTDLQLYGGSTADNTLGIANAIPEDKRQDMCEIKFTVISALYTNAGKTNSLFYLLTGGRNLAEQIGSTGTYAGRGGWKTGIDTGAQTLATTDRFPHPVVLYMVNGTDEIWFLLNHARASDFEWGMDAEGHQELTMTMKCMPRDFWVQVQ